MSKHGLFVGLVTLDLIYLVERLPTSNQKIVAVEYAAAAGGPATNAAVAFCHLGNQSTLLAGVGCHPMNQLIRADLQQCGVTIADLDPIRSEPPSVSSIFVTRSTGERAVVSINAVNARVETDPVSDRLTGVDVVLIDGHQMTVGAAIAQQAKQRGTPVVMDGGSWKPGFEQVLPWVNYAVCSANFHPPGCHTSDQVFAYLENFGLSHIAITQGEKAIHYLSNGIRGHLEVPVVQAIDTLGAGDIFHGAFCYFILQSDFSTALAQASTIAAHACQFFGTRQWMAPDR